MLLLVPLPELLDDSAAGDVFQLLLQRTALLPPQQPHQVLSLFHHPLGVKVHQSFFRRREKSKANRCCLLPECFLIQLPRQQLLEGLLKQLDDLYQLQPIFNNLIQLPTLALLSRQALNHPFEVFSEVHELLHTLVSILLFCQHGDQSLFVLLVVAFELGESLREVYAHLGARQMLLIYIFEDQLVSEVFFVKASF